MKRKRFLIASIVSFAIAGLLLCVFIATSYAAGTVTQVLTPNNRTGVHKLVFAYVADSGGGSVPATASNAPIDGYVFLVTTNPGTTAPTANYDITLTDTDGVDIMAGDLADRSATVSEQEDAAYGSRYVEGILTLTITNNSVNSAVGTVNVYYYDK